MRAITKAKISQTALARELASDHENPDTWLRTRLREWLRGARTVDVELAYRVGKTLQSIGHPYATGLLTVLAAGYIGDVYAVLRNVVLSESDARVLERVRMFVEHAPMIVEADIASQVFLMSPAALEMPHLAWGDFPEALRDCPGFHHNFFAERLTEQRDEAWCNVQDAAFNSRRTRPKTISEDREKVAVIGDALARVAVSSGLSPWDALDLCAQSGDRWTYELRRAAFEENAAESWTEWDGRDSYYLKGYFDLLRWNREKMSEAKFALSMERARAAIEAGDQYLGDFVNMLGSLRPATPHRHGPQS